jgi:uncharacterized protein
VSAGFTRISRETFGPWALITGASSGIGAEFARQLAANGFDVALAARRLPLLEQAGARLATQYGVKYRTVQVDLADPACLATITSATDELDIGLVISNADDMILGEFLGSEPDRLFADMRLNVASHLGLCTISDVVWPAAAGAGSSWYRPPPPCSRSRIPRVTPRRRATC